MPPIDRARALSHHIDECARDFVRNRKPISIIAPILRTTCLIHIQWHLDDITYCFVYENIGKTLDGMI